MISENISEVKGFSGKIYTNGYTNGILKKIAKVEEIILFELLQPNKKEVGERLRQVKEELKISFTEFGNRLGLKKPTINAYVQGYNLAPLEIIEKVAKISDRPIGWFYFGSIEEYIASYLKLKGGNAFLQEHPDTVDKIKQEFYSGEFKNPAWENEFGYPVEEFIDECFAEVKDVMLKADVATLVKEAIDQSEKFKEIPAEKKADFAMVITTNIVSFLEMDNGLYEWDKERILAMIQRDIEGIDTEEDVQFDEHYLVGKLINVLKDEEQTTAIIKLLSAYLTDKHFSTFFGGEELVKIFQSMRPALIQLYSEKTPDDFYEWFEK